MERQQLSTSPARASAVGRRRLLLTVFITEYNQRRPYRSLPHLATPATIYDALPKAAPGADRTRETHERVRHDVIDNSGCVTLRHDGRLHHVGIGRTHTRTRVMLQVQDLDIRIINAATGELLRELILDPRRDYQPTGAPEGPPRRPARPQQPDPPT